MRLLVDSTFVIDYLRGDRDAFRRWQRAFEDGDEPVINEVVVCEVRAGLRSSEATTLEIFLEPVEFVQPPPAAALKAGEWRAACRSRGITLGLADALIAAAAWFDGAAILTRNARDFALTPVRVETY
jgi:predicted nucleic acid-binding protein